MIPSTTLNSTEIKNQIGTLFNELIKLYPDLARMSEFENLYCRAYRDVCVFYIRYSGEPDDCSTFGYESIIIGNCIKLLQGYYWLPDSTEPGYIVYNCMRHIVSIENTLCLALLVALKLSKNAK